MQNLQQVIPLILKIPLWNSLAEPKFNSTFFVYDSQELYSSLVPWCKTVHRSRPRCSTGPRTAFGRERKREKTRVSTREASEKHLHSVSVAAPFGHMQIDFSLWHNKLLLNRQADRQWETTFRGMEACDIKGLDLASDHCFTLHFFCTFYIFLKA